MKTPAIWWPRHLLWNASTFTFEFVFLFILLLSLRGKYSTLQLILVLTFAAIPNIFPEMTHYILLLTKLQQ